MTILIKNGTIVTLGAECKVLEGHCLLIEGDKIKKRTLANLSDWPPAKIEALRRVLRDEAVAGDLDEIEHVLEILVVAVVRIGHGHVRRIGIEDAQVLHL